MTLDNFVEADILATCNALGTQIKGVYQKGFECVECLKDILRYLRRDSDEHAILRYLGSLRLLQTDLLPLIKRFDKDKEIFEFTLRILTALTNPAILLFKEEVPEDKISRNLYLQIISYLQNYKKAFVEVGVWEILSEHLKNLLKMRPIERSSDENLLIERILILIRNVLHVPHDESILKQTDEDLSLHDKVIWSLHQSKIDILLLYITANEEEHQYCMHALEIVSLMLREHTAETIACSNETRSDIEKQKDLNMLLSARQREQNLKLQKVQSICKSRFNGVYCVKNMKSLSDNDYIAHRLINNIDDVKFDLPKAARRKPKNRVPAPEIDTTRQSTLSIRLFLKKFCIEFLKTYNKLMVSVKRELLRKVSEDQDETYYLWAVCYFMQFNRLYDFETALVSETISTQTFHHINTQMTNYYEMMLSDKKKTMFWAKRMQLGVRAYKELLETLRKMERSEEDVVRNSADALVSHVFYVIEYREMLLSLLSNYDQVKFPLSYLADLVESIQIFLKMLENHSKKHSKIIVQKKQRKIRKKKKKQIATSESINEEEQLNNQWDAVTSALSAAVQGRRPIPQITPFDGASEIPFEEQKIDAVYQIREALLAKEPFKALGLLRAARELWPEGDSFGTSDIEPEPEFLILREIHFSNLKKDHIENPIMENVEESEDDEEEESIPTVAEQQLDLNDVYNKYASPKIVQPCALLFANYQSNKPQTNMCLIKLLHRIAWNCKMHALFFQSTIFLTFQKLFHDPEVNHDPAVKEFYRFAKFIVQKFFQVAEKNEKVYVELLFWTGHREAYELEEGYGTSESKVKGWTEDEEEELKYIFEENKDIYIEGQDVADIILANLNKSRTKNEVILALKRLDLIKNKKDLRPEKRSEWIESEIVDLQHLFDDYKTSGDIMGNILEKLSIKRSRKAVVDKLLELNLIHDRKEVRKKGSRKKKSGHEGSDGNSSDESDELQGDNDYDIVELSGRNIQSDSGSDEDERNFFKNLEAERFAEDCNSSQNGGNDRDSYTEKNMEQKRKTLNKNDTTQPSKFWEEQEIMELTTLFHENEESNEILQVLLNSLTIKRPKQAIIEKLLELGLVKNKNDINKKKRSKSKKDMHNITRDDSDIENSLSMQNKAAKEKKKLKRRLLSDSDEDVPLSSSSLLNDSKIDSNQIAEKQKKKKEPIVWEEQEVILLNQLFLENMDSDDVMACILKGLPLKRTKKDITDKLLEIGLVKDRKEIKKKISVAGREIGTKPKKKKATDLWEEQEILQLNQLFEEGKDSDDIMLYILNGLTFKRPKPSVVEKLLEIGLINDKKEIRKKRVAKKQKPGNKSDDSDEESKDKQMKGKKKTVRKNQTSIENAQDNVKSKKKLNKKSILSESSDDESLPVSHVVASNVERDMNYNSISQKHITHKMKNKAIILESSDDEILPLSNIISSSYSKTFPTLVSEGPELNEEVSSVKNAHIHSRTLNIQNTVVAIDAAVETKNLTLRTGKRKRLLISDDSSDNDAPNNILDSNDDYLIDKTNLIIDKVDNSNEPHATKLQKRKLRVLDDSDDE